MAAAAPMAAAPSGAAPAAATPCPVGMCPYCHSIGQQNKIKKRAKPYCTKSCATNAAQAGWVNGQPPAAPAPAPAPPPAPAPGPAPPTATATPAAAAPAAASPTPTAPQYHVMCPLNLAAGLGMILADDLTITSVTPGSVEVRSVSALVGHHQILQTSVACGARRHLWGLCRGARCWRSIRPPWLI